MQQQPLKKRMENATSTASGEHSSQGGNNTSDVPQTPFPENVKKHLNFEDETISSIKTERANRKGAQASEDAAKRLKKKLEREEERHN